MNSLSDLNYESSKSLPFADTREASTVFDPSTPEAQVVVFEANQPFVLPNGTSIVSLVNTESEFITTSIDGYDDAYGLTYRVTQNIAGTVNTADIDEFTLSIASRVTFAGIPTQNSGYTPLTDIGSGGMYVKVSWDESPNYTKIYYSVYGIKTVSDFNLVKNPLVTYPISSPTANYFKGEILGTSINKSWYITVNPILENELTVASDAYYYSYNYYEGLHATVITSVPVVTPGANTSLHTDSYTCTVSASNNSAFGNITATGTLGGTSSWSTTNKILTITGNANQVNSHLSNMHYQPAQNFAGTFYLNYAVYNPTTKFTSTQSQVISCIDNQFNAALPIYYDDNTVTAVDGPNFQYGGNPTGNLTISASNPDALYTLSSTYGTGTSTWDNINKELVISGYASDIVGHLDNISMHTADEFKQNFTLNYNLQLTTGSYSQIQNIYYRNVDPLVANVTVSRHFISNTIAQNLFDVYVPKILEDAEGDPTYTVNLTSTAGSFNFNSDTGNLYSTLSFSGNVSTVNDKFYDVNFYPTKDVSGSQTLTIQILRDTDTIVNQTVPFIGAVRETSISGQTFVYSSSQTVTLPQQLILYKNCDIMLVSGGGGGGKSSIGTPGGGGGGGVYAAKNVTLPLGSLTITIGAGGAAATSDASNGYPGGLSTIAHLGTTVLSSQRAGYGGGGRNDVGARDGGAYNGVTYAITGLADSVGTTDGGFWWHKGGTGYSTIYGGGGGGARATAAGGNNLSMMNATSSGGGWYGDAMTGTDFYLAGSGYSGYPGISGGGDGFGHGISSAPTNPGYGGDGGDASHFAQPGAKGIIVIRFY